MPDVAPVPSAPATPLDVARLRRDFPILGEPVHDRRLVYLDSAATAQKPRAVIDAVSRHYAADNGGVHRGVHALVERATRAYEGARARVRRFLNAAHEREIVFVRGATEGINLVAATYGREHVRAGDEIVVTVLEHHSNIVPWQRLCEERGAHLRVVPISDAGDLVLDHYERLLGPRTRLVAVTHVSNALGTVNPVAEMTRLAHDRGAVVLVDGAQAAPHLGVDVRALGCDFYVFSGHKLYGPTGIGALYGRAELLDAMPPYEGGGDMIERVSFDETTYARPPARFEAGMPNVAGAVGLAAAIDYVGAVGLDRIAAHERQLLALATEAVASIPGLRLVAAPRERASILSFVMDGVHPHDVGTILDREGVAVRTGHHCAQPLMDRLGVAATVRASFALYNGPDDVAALTAGLRAVREVFTA